MEPQKANTIAAKAARLSGAARHRSHITLVLGIGSLLALTACGSAERLAGIGSAPDMSKIENPVMKEGYQPISLPMPSPKVSSRQANSLWDGSRQTFFKDQRAKQVGDIITVMVDISDQAQIDNETKRSRKNAEKAGLDNLLGYEAGLNRIFPESVDNANLVGADSDSSHDGKGSIDREEDITVKLAALVTQILPNGNMVISGRQEVRVNFEKRVLSIEGVIRPEDITIDNAISYEKIAEARIGYGGEGQITDVQQPRYGQQLYDIIFPF